MKLNEIAKSDPFEGIKTSFMYVQPNSTYGKLLTTEEFLEAAARGDTGNVTATFSGSFITELRFPSGIRYLYEFAADYLTMNDYSNFPTTDIFSVDQCTLGDGFAEYVRNKISKTTEVTNSPLSMDDVLQLTFTPSLDFKYYMNLDGDWLRIVSDMSHKCRISYQRSENRDHGILHFNDEFDAQDWLINNDTEKYFK